MRVLVISPDQDLGELLLQELAPTEFQVLARRPGPGVIEVARGARPEIAVIHCDDARREVAVLEHAILRASRPEVRTIVVSSASSPDDGNLVEAGIFYYMSASPPVRLPDVIRAAARSIRKELDRQRRAGEAR